MEEDQTIQQMIDFSVFNAIFSNISAISWREKLQKNKQWSTKHYIKLKIEEHESN